MTRRKLISTVAGGALLLRGQGMSRRSVAPTPRGKPSGLPFHSKFTDIAAAAGLRSPVIYGAPEHKQYLVETVGCGVAFIDYDNDGWLDIFLPGGSRLEGAPAEATNRLYRNNRDGTFTDVTARSGLRHSGWACAVCAGDYDNDGFEDLFLTYWGGCTLYHNDGDGTFTDVTAKSGISLSRTEWGSGCTFIDYDRDGRLDLLVAHYTDFDLKAVPKMGEAASCNWKGVPVPCGPRGLPAGGLRLYHNNGDGTFSDVSKASGIAKATGSYPMTAVAADFDNDGWTDLYVACDSTASFLLKNNHDGTFQEIGLESGVALNEDGMEQAGMGIAIGDYNLDGNLDIFKTHFADDTNILYRNDGKSNFTDVTVASNLGVETRYTSWGTAMVDLDNDGNPDLFLVTGSIYPELKLPAYPYQTPRVIFRNLGGGKFEEIVEGAQHSSRGCAFGDFDNDGDIDVLVINMNEPPSLLRNDVSGGGRWLKIKLVGVQSNRSAIGATVIVTYGNKRQAQPVLSQGSFYSVNDSRLHFGLGAEKKASIEIRWPSGLIETIPTVDSNQILTIKEGAQK